MTTNKPSQYEKEQSIQYIVNQGIDEPESLVEFFRRMNKKLGFKYIFFDQHLIIASWLTLIAAIILFLSFQLFYYSYALIFLVSPIFFLSISSMTLWLEESNPLVDLKKTLKISLADTVLYQILTHTFISLILSTLLAFGMDSLEEVFRATAISLSSLLIGMILFTYVFKYIKTPLSSFFAAPIWIVLNAIPLISFRDIWNQFLSDIPILILLIAITTLSYLYLKHLRASLNIRIREDDNFATT